LQLDRYVPARGAASNQDHTGPILIPHSSASSDSSNPSTGTLPDPDPTHTSDLSAALGLDSSKRILSFFAEPPPSQTEHSALLASYARLPSRSSSMASTSSATTTRRRIASAPERVLDAPGLVDDYYLNLLDWSSTNLVAVGLGESVYVWNATSGTVDLLCSVGGTPATEDEYVCSVRFAEDGSYLAVGVSSGTVQMYDLSTGKCVRNMRGHLDRVASLCWSGAILSSGSKTGEIWNSDVRISQHKVAELSGHRAEVCGLEWRPEVAGGLSGGGQGVSIPSQDLMSWTDGTVECSFSQVEGMTTSSMCGMEG
jgi:cell division cycle protein 20 (cofactor of APC complex)